LNDVFDAVINVKLTDTYDTSALQLLGRPDLGVTATKVACWTLTQYSKCVFLDADTLVLSNVDELFERPEFSAAPDVGWPDCFNSGVFVYVPSHDTYGKLLETLATEGSFDGGDQGLLNTYFASWATADAAQRLPFGYNMTTNASYSYAPALARFHDSIKIIHFIGADKPWRGINTGGLVDKWHTVHADLIQHGSRKPKAGSAAAVHPAGSRSPDHPDAPAHWGRSAQTPDCASGDGGYDGGAPAPTSSGFDLVKGMLDAAIETSVPADSIKEEAEEKEEVAAVTATTTATAPATAPAKK
jgi:glycogenin glucosyltransferase